MNDTSLRDQFDPGGQFNVLLGGGQVIAGFNQAVLGMFTSPY